MGKHSDAFFRLSKLISPAKINSHELKKIIFSSEREWMAIIDLANQKLLIPALYSGLKDKGLLDLLEDKLMIEYITTVYEFNRKRNEGIVVQLQDISNVLKEIDVRPVLLKGATVLSEGYYHHIGARVMIDIDILVPEEKIVECIELLERKRGYRPLEESTSEWSSHHYQRISSDLGAAAVELHFRSLSKAYFCFPNEELMKHTRASKTIKNADVLEPLYDLYHVFLHSQVSDRSHRNHILALRQLHHASFIAVVCEDEIDWSHLSKMIKKHSLSDIWNDYLYSLKELFKVNIPTLGIGHSKHFEKSIYAIDNPYTKNKIFEFYFALKDALSYNALKLKYNFTSRLGYPLALVKYLSYLLLKYIPSLEKKKIPLKYFGPRNPTTVKR